MPIAPSTIREDSPNGRAELIKDILRTENWPTPLWYDKSKKTRRIRSFEEYFTFQLQSKYLELENDLRSVLGNYSGGADVITAERINDLLHSARESLEHAIPNLLVVSSSLDLVERYMVWLYPNWIARAQIDSLLLKLNSISFNGKQLIFDQLTKLSEIKEEVYPGQICSVLDGAIGSINAQVIQNQISNGLQINRLKSLRLWGCIILLLFFLMSPFIINPNTSDTWPSQSILTNSSPQVSAWINALTMLLVGAVGGFLSGLLQARNSHITLTEYLEDMLKLQLKPLVGAIVALILYTVLSWQVIPGITIENTGSYFVIAFLSGFSERYFLRILDIKSRGDGKIGDQTITNSFVKETLV